MPFLYKKYYKNLTHFGVNSYKWRSGTNKAPDIRLINWLLIGPEKHCLQECPLFSFKFNVFLYFIFSQFDADVLTKLVSITVSHWFLYNTLQKGLCPCVERQCKFRSLSGCCMYMHIWQYCTCKCAAHGDRCASLWRCRVMITLLRWLLAGTYMHARLHLDAV